MKRHGPLTKADKIFAFVLCSSGTIAALAGFIAGALAHWRIRESEE